MLLLDTCVILMLADSQELIPSKTLKFLGKTDDQLVISSISAFEIALKYKLKRLDLPMSPIQWYRLALETHDLMEISVDGDIAMAAAELPFIHKDPCDRIIISTALKYSATLITPDKTIRNYPKVKVLW